jgi:hypothetical protein
MKKARIENGVVREVLDRDPFPPFSPALQWVECGAEVVEGYIFESGVFAEPAPKPFPEPLQKILTVDILADMLKIKGIISDAEIENAKK